MNRLVFHHNLLRCAGVALAFVLVAIAFSQAVWAGQNTNAVETPKDVAGFHAMELQIQSVARKAIPAVLGIRVANAWGSGVLVSEDGIVMSAGHVVSKPGLEAKFYFSDGRVAHGVTLGVFDACDAGLLKITDAGKWPFLKLGHSETLKQGAWCVAIGHPLGFKAGRPPVVRIGRILEHAEDVIRTDCPLVGGDSGGPLLDLSGDVIGVNSRIAVPTDANMHVPVDVFRKYWDRLVKGEVLIPALPSRNSDDVRLPLRKIMAGVNPCVVRVRCDKHNAVLGTIVGPDGWILTKASELRGRVTCRLRDGRELEAKIVGVHVALDLAMLKVDATGLPAIPWNPLQPAVGQWLATAGLGDEPLAVGIVSVPRRAIPPTAGVIGVVLSEGDSEARIEKVISPSPAEKAGLKAGDVVTHIDGEAAPNTKELRNQLRRHRPGETIKLIVRRDAKTLEIPVQVAAPVSAAIEHQKKMNSMGVGVSKRSDDFPSVLQHDTIIKPSDCGGPVVDLSGKVIGVNIAHAGRTETYCIPTDTLLGTMYDLMSGRLAPSAMNVAKQAAAPEKASQKAPEKKAEQDKDKKAPANEKPSEKPSEKKPEAKPPEKPAEKQPPQQKSSEVKPPVEAKPAEKQPAEKQPEQKKPDEKDEKKAAESKASPTVQQKPPAGDVKK